MKSAVVLHRLLIQVQFDRHKLARGINNLVRHQNVASPQLIGHGTCEARRDDPPRMMVSNGLQSRSCGGGRSMSSFNNCDSYRMEVAGMLNVRRTVHRNSVAQ